MLRSISMAIMMVVALLVFATGSVSAAPRQLTTTVDICDRTQEVQTAILAEKGGTCSTVTDTQLASITILAITGYSSAIIVPGDFAGLTTLDNLRISDSPLLTTVPANAFSAVTTSLTALQLDANSISSVDQDAFLGLSDLIYLFLHDNSIASLHEDTFDGLTALTDLLLHDNSIASLHEDTFDGLTALTELILNDNNIASLHEDVFDGLTALTRLLLMNNHIKVLEDGIFEDTTALQEISMQHNRVSILDEDTFDGLANLKSVNLSFNRVSWLHKDTFHGLANLIDLNLQGNRISSLHEDIFHGLANLNRLSLNENSISSLDGDIFDDLVKLQTLYLQNNRITALQANLFDKLTALRFLYLFSNSTESLDKDVFKGLTALKTLFLHRNSIESLDGDIFDGLTALTDLALSYNSLSSLPSSLFDEPTALQTLYLNNNGIASLHEDLFDGLTALRTLYLTDNGIASPDVDLFAGLTGLQTLDLSNNGLASSDVDLFAGLTGLRTLYLNDNGIASPDVDLFAGLTGLQTLDLNDNGIASLPEDLFDGLTGLRTLFLNDNGLASLNVDLFDGLVGLSTLDLSDNSITGLTAGVFEDLDDSLTSLYLRSNGLASLPANIFDGLIGLTGLDLSCNALTALDLARFDPFASTLTFLEISGNSFTTPPPETALNDKLTSPNPKYIYTGANTLCGPPDDTELSELSISPGSSPNAAGIAMVAHDVSTTTITITARDPNAEIEPYPDKRQPLYDDDPNMPGWQVKLPSYRNGFQWRVRAKNGLNTAIGSIVVFRAGPPASEARLRSLALSGVTLAETFDNGIQTYMATAAADATETTVTATPLDPDATAVIKLGGVMGADGTVNLAAGSNVITVEVTAEDGTTMQTYTVTVTRMVSNSKPTFDDGESTMRSLPENPTTVTNVGVAVAASDSDSGDTLTYALKSGGDSGSFTIVSTSGQIQTKTNVTYDFESAKKTYTVTVTVHDGKDADGGTSTAVDDEIVVTINLTNVDDPGTASITGTLSGGETLTAGLTDPDGSTSSKTYRWQRGDSAIGSFSTITTNGTSMTYTLVAADVEKYLRVKVTYTDPQGSGKMATSAATGPVGASNSKPAFADDSVTRTLPENSGPSVNVVGGVVTASDGDSDTLTYSLTGTDAGKFEIDSNGQIKTKSGVNNTFNFEDTSNNSFSVTVQVHDGKDAAGNTDTSTIDDTIAVTINLTNVNEEPTFTGGGTGTTFPENSTDGIETFTASDVDAGDVLTWSVHSRNDGGLFQISSAGVLTFNDPPDFEDPMGSGGDGNTYVVTVVVTDQGGLTAERHIAIGVTDVNETPTITNGPSTISKNENTAITAVIATYVATDPDATTGTMTWDLQGNDAGAFTILSTINGTATLHFKNVPNFESAADTGTNNVYDVTVRVRDNVSTPLQDTQVVTVDVEDLNEAPVVSGTALPSFAEIAYDATSPDLTIGTYTYTDEDRNPSDTISWDLSGTDETHFDIVSTTGVLSFKMRPDFENPFGADNVYVFVVEADDDQGGVGTFNVTVTVTNVDETPEITTQADTHTDPSFMEIEYDATTADLTVADYDARDEEGQTITWSRAGMDSGDFTIDSSSGVLSFAQRPNFEVPTDSSPHDNVYDITVSARDTASNTRTIVVTVTVTDVNERPDINEDTVPSYMEIEYHITGTRPDVHTFSATDYDDGDTVEWTLLGTDADAGDLEIDGGSGVLTFIQNSGLGVGPLPNFELPQDDNADGSNTYNITVVATDNRGYAAEYAVTITVTDVNEVPEFMGTPETSINLDEHDANDEYAVMDLANYTARDEEGGVTWTLTGTDSGDFAIDSNGVVTFVNTPNYEAPEDSGGNNEYEFTVVATDVQSGSNRLTVSIDNVTVTVADVEEAGVITVDDPNPGVGDTIIFTLTDPDGGIGGSVYSWNVQGREPGEDWQTLFRYDNIPATVEYTADEDHVGLEVRAVVASYQDRRGSGKSAESEPTTAVTADPVANAPPRFLGPGPQFVPEGPAGQNVGDPPEVSDRENDILTFGLTGSDSQYFGIDASTGQIRTTQELDYETTTGPLFIVVTLHDGKDDDGNVEADPMVDATKILDLTATDVEEDGVVTLSSTEPEVGTLITAIISDGDGGVSGAMWRWSRSENGRNGWVNISGATSSSYTPVDADGDFFLRARVEYTDRRGGGKIADAFTTNPTPSENKRPTFPSTETGARTVEENTRAGVSIGDPVAAEDPEGDRLVYTLAGMDAAAFTIVEGTGQLRTKEPLNFETKPSYSVTVEVHDGRDSLGQPSTTVDDTQSVTITVENVEEPGTVTLSTATATIQARVKVTAELSDDDGPSGVSWQWARSPNGRTEWVNIAGATSATYLPTLEEDQGNYIRALANYTDGHGQNKTANDVSPRVGDAPPINSAPAFLSTENGQREVAEDATGGANFGDPVAATDFNNDTLYYSLSGTDAASFEIGQNTGQLSLASSVTLDFESKRTYRFTVEVGDGKDPLDDSDDPTDPTFVATDARQSVTVTVTNVNEMPVVTGDDSPSFAENGSNAVASYTGTDPERDTLTWTVSGNDFWISERGQLYFRSPPSFEDQKTYTVDVIATDDDETTPLSGSLVVTVTVTDAEEEGVVTIIPPRGWVDTKTEFSADLTDDDGGITGKTWQWARSPNGRSSWAEIADATSDSYTVTADDANQYLRATVSYDDRRGSGKTASAMLAGRIGDVRPSVNEPPMFAAATDTSSIGQGTAAGRSIGAPVRATDAETTANRSIGQGTAAGRSIGAPVQATDPDENEVLTYSLSGQEADKFDIDPATGQLRTKAVLDLEEQPKYTVTVSVYDGFNPEYDPNNEVDDRITVTITVTAVAQRVVTGGGGGGGFGPALTAPKFVDGFRTTRPLALSARPGDAVGDPVAATHPNDDDVTYSLSGANAALFTVDEETGQIRLGQAVTLELGQTYTVNLTATDSSGTGVIIIVDIEVAEGVGDPYDLNRDGIISKDEVLKAVADYFADLIDKDEVLALVARYFAA